MNIKFFSGSLRKENSFERILSTLEKQSIPVRQFEEEFASDWDFKTI